MFGVIISKCGRGKMIQFGALEIRRYSRQTQPNIMVEKDFYKLQELTREDIDILQEFVKKNNSIPAQYSQSPYSELRFHS